MYQIKMLECEEDILSCEPLSIRCFNWGGSYRPVSFAQAGLLKEKGFLIRLSSQETNPLCTYSHNDNPVYLDSALEAFLQLNPEHDLRYINLELNSAGALLAKFGKDRADRISFTKSQYECCPTWHGQNEDGWWVQVLLPFSLIEEFYGPLSFAEGTKIRCNFFKISESKSVEHFASYAPISYPTPNFHLPEFFADAVIIK